MFSKNIKKRTVYLFFKIYSTILHRKPIDFQNESRLMLKKKPT